MTKAVFFPRKRSVACGINPRVAFERAYREGPY
jgi:hypothetical protein